MCVVAVAEIAITSVIALLPTSTLGAPWYPGFGWSSVKYVNYTPLVLGFALLALWVGWHLSAKKWFTGPKMTIDLPPGLSAADEIAPEHQGKSGHLPTAEPGPVPTA
jgi:hypothetical protein